MLNSVMELCFQLKKLPHEFNDYHAEEIALLIAKLSLYPHLDSFYGFAQALTSFSEDKDINRWYKPNIEQTKLETKEQTLKNFKAYARSFNRAMEDNAKKQNLKTRHASRHPEGETGHGQERKGSTPIQE